MDNDLIRGDDAGEGTALTGVRGLMNLEFDGFSGFSNECFLPDHAALATVGTTMAEVADSTPTTFTDRGLNWSELRFPGTPIEPVLPPPSAATVWWATRATT